MFGTSFRDTLQRMIQQVQAAQQTRQAVAPQPHEGFFGAQLPGMINQVMSTLPPGISGQPRVGGQPVPISGISQISGLYGRLPGMISQVQSQIPQQGSPAVISGVSQMPQMSPSLFSGVSQMPGFFGRMPGMVSQVKNRLSGYGGLKR